MICSSLLPLRGSVPYLLSEKSAGREGRDKKPPRRPGKTLFGCLVERLTNASNSFFNILKKWVANRFHQPKPAAPKSQIKRIMIKKHDFEMSLGCYPKTVLLMSAKL
jgi:hypothetical protein